MLAFEERPYFHFVKYKAARSFPLLLAIGGASLALRTAYRCLSGIDRRLRTERKQAEEALHLSEARFAAFMDYLPGAAWIKDLEGRYVYINPEAARIFRADRQSIRGKTDAALFPPETAKHFRENDRRALSARQALRTMETLRQTDGIDHHSLVSKFAIPGPDGSPAYIGGVAIDLTDQHRAEEDLRKSEERFRTLADNMSQFAWMADDKGSLFWYNKRWYDYTDTNFEQMRGSGWQAVLHPEHLQRVQEKLSRSIRTGEIWEDTFPLRRRDGEYRWFLSRAVPIKNEHGQVVRWFGTNTDITDRKRSEEELAAAKHAAEQASAAKDHFLAVLSHELRTPLTPVVAAISILQDDSQLPQDQQETLEMARRNVELEARLIDDLLDVTRVAQGKIELHKRTVQLWEIIRRAVEVCRSDITARGLELILDLGSDAPDMVEADTARLQQVFWNLLKNSIKFTPPGGIVRISCTRSNGHVVAEVTDNGQGMERDALARIFNAFEQAEHSIARRFGGLGLGLAISKALVELHGGSIEAHSDGLGKGATFRVRLPIAAAASEPI